MGSIDTLEIKTVADSPPIMVLHSHRFGRDISCQVDQDYARQMIQAMEETGATFWLRSVSRVHNPFFVFWIRYSDFASLMRIKRGASRRDITLSCTPQTGKSLLALVNAEWSNAA